MQWNGIIIFVFILYFLKAIYLASEIASVF